MPKYINADEYVIIPVVEKMDDEPSQLPITIGDLIKRITKKEPKFADVREVVNGHWIFIDKNDCDENETELYMCSVCGEFDSFCSDAKVPFCWHCGAIMNEGDE